MKTASSLASASARSMISTLRLRKRAANALPAPSPLTTRIPLTVSSTSVDASAQLACSSRVPLSYLRE
jgi:hypothetical protein